MRPQDTPQPQPTVSVPERDGYSLVSQRDHPAAAASMPASQAAAAELSRKQIDSIFANDPNSLMAIESEPATHAPAPVAPAPQPAPATNPPAAAASQHDTSTPNQQKRFSERTIAPLSQSDPLQDSSKNVPSFEAENPYERTHQNDTLAATDANWQQYHTAWQQYYQQYFHRYYSTHLEKMAAELKAQKSSPKETSPEQAMHDIRSRIRATVRERATKVRKSRHFVPAMAAFGVMLVFTFLQYNSFLLSNIYAYISPGNLESSDIIVDPSRSSVVGPDPLLVIPKINVRVPVVWDVTPDHPSQMRAMEEGVAWFGIPGANSKPGQIGNTVLSGHSSNDFFESGKYKFVFAPLEKLQQDDLIEIHYKGTLYKYVVTKKEVVLPTQVDKLIYDTDKPILTLITCTPLGTALKRLLITAEQVSPSPSSAKPAPAGSGGSGGSIEMPGTEPTVLERAFGRG